MRTITKYKIVSDVDGYVEKRDGEEQAERRAKELNSEYPGQEHHVEEATETYS